MTTEVIIARPGIEGKGIGLLVDEDYANTLAADFGIPETDVKDALLGHPKLDAYRVCEWVETTEAKSPLQRGKVLTAWAKKYKAGRYARRSAGPRGGATITPRRRGEARIKFSNAQIAANLDRMGS